jgi:hypothetical protein
MSWPTIAFKLTGLALLALLVPACGGATSGTIVEEPSSSDDPFVFKMSYFRALPEPKTKRLEPHFRVVMSESWRDRMGESPKEPLAKAAPGRIYMGYIPDAHMVRYEKKLKELGLDDLTPRATETLDPEALGRKAVHSDETSFTRVITIGNAKGSKSYYYRDQQTSKDLIEKFIKCETFISRACEYAIQVSTKSDPLPTRPR